MKLLKNSIALVMVLGVSTSLCADTLEDAFKNGKVSGALKFTYTDASKVDVAGLPSNNKTSGAVGVHLNYSTGNFNGLKAVMSFQASHDLGLHDNESERESRMAFSEASMSQAYLQYSFKKSNIKIGKQYIYTPLILTASAYPMYDSYTGAVFTTMEIPNTVVQAMYIKDLNKRTSDDVIHYEKPLYSLFAVNKSITGLKLMGQYLITNEKSNNFDYPVPVSGGYSQYFIQSDYMIPKSPITFSAQYGGASFDKPAEKDSSMYGTKVSAKLDGINLNVAYTSVSDDNSFPGTLGHVPDALLFNGLNQNVSLHSGVDVLSSRFAYNFGISGLKLTTTLALFSQSDEGANNNFSFNYLDGAKELDVNIEYKLSGDLKGLKVKLESTYATYDLPMANSEDTFKYMKLNVDYKF